MIEKRCPRCRHWTWNGHEARPALALPVTMDAAELDTAGELEAIRSGGRTWSRRWNGDTYLRTAETMRREPAGLTPRRTVHADHVCEGTDDGPTARNP